MPAPMACHMRREDDVSSDAAAAKGASAAKKDRRRGPSAWFAAAALFVRQVVAELRKVVYPTRSQLGTYTVVVLVFVGIIMLIVSLMDLALGQFIRSIFS
jgi:preprotein translocase subunit SecE